jgi:cell division protein FtsB
MFVGPALGRHRPPRGLLLRTIADFWPWLPWPCELGSVSSGSLFVQRVMPLAVLALAAISVPMLMLSSTGLPRLQGLREEKVRADDEVSRLSEEIWELRAEVARIKDDPAAVERAARDELGLVRRTEVVFQFHD